MTHDANASPNPIGESPDAGDEWVLARCCQRMGIDPTTAAGRDQLAEVRRWLPQAKAIWREWKRNRLRETQAERRLQGLLVNGCAGYGFKLIGPQGRRRKVPAPREREVMRLILEWRQGGKTWRQIWRYLLENRVRNLKGKEWSLSRIRRAYEAELALRASDGDDSGESEGNSAIIDSAPPREQMG